MKHEPLADCIICAKPFMRANTLQTVCSVKCARQVPIVNRKAEREKYRATRERLKPRSKWLREAQAAFNAYIRIRDAAKPCVSCGRHHNGQWHAGHYLSTGARPELRFDERNVSKQCAPCNSHLHGNIVLYRAELIRRIGLAEVERLEGTQPPRKFTIPDLREIRDKYRTLAREAMSMERQGLE